MSRPHEGIATDELLRELIYGEACEAAGNAPTGQRPVSTTTSDPTTDIADIPALSRAGRNGPSRSPETQIAPGRLGSRLRHERDPDTSLPSPRTGRREETPPETGPSRDGILGRLVAFGLPVAMVGSFLAAVHMAFSGESWVYKFFLERSPVQWAILYVFACGVVALLRRLGAYLGERRALRSLRARKMDGQRPSLTWWRFRRFRSYLVHRGFDGAQDYARTLAENDASELDAAYAFIGDVIQMLPMLGFFGTVLGLSVGLYNYFLTPNAHANISAFTRALATAFDTTLLGLACTIIIISLQRPLRKRDDVLLAELNRSIDDYYFSILPSRQEVSRGREERCEATLQRLDAELRQARRVVAAEARGIASACATAVSTAAREMAAAARRVIDESRAAQEAFRQEVVAALTSQFVPGVEQAVETHAGRCAENLERLAAAVRDNSAAVVDGLARVEEQHRNTAQTLLAQVERLNQTLNRTRRFTIVECPETSDETSDAN